MLPLPIYICAVGTPVWDPVQQFPSDAPLNLGQRSYRKHLAPRPAAVSAWRKRSKWLLACTEQLQDLQTGMQLSTFIDCNMWGTPHPTHQSPYTLSNRVEPGGPPEACTFMPCTQFMPQDISPQQTITANTSLTTLSVQNEAEPLGGCRQTAAIHSSRSHHSG